MSGARRWIWLLPIGLVVTALLSVIVVWQQKDQIETQLANASQSALTDAGLPTGTISFNGRDATLSEFPPDKIAAALNVVRKVDGVRAATAGEATGPASNSLPSTSVPAATSSPATNSSVVSSSPSSPTPVDAKQALQLHLNEQLDTNPITFEPNTATLTSQGQEAVQKIAELLTEAPLATKFEVAGHVAKTTGPADGALTLSKERAQQVVALLVKAGIASKRMVAKGYGDTRPSTNGDDRRVEIIVR